MKDITKKFSLLFIFLSALLITTSSFSTKNPDGAKEFKIEFERFKGGLIMNGLEGTAFSKLFFALGNYVQRPIDEFGTTIAYVKTSSIDDSVADFEFTIEKVDEEYTLVGKKGTTWTKLIFKFSESNKVIVDQNGVTVK
ncbi:MAG TPA: hypothetical protein VFU05_14295 [Cyclobacteriaceae bacterium]|nr:hypothetical protein [Cyclobacteriaceae bacterium]